MVGYCVKCQIDREIVDPTKVIVPKRGDMIKGTCSVCGTVIYVKA